MTQGRYGNSPNTQTPANNSETISMIRELIRWPTIDPSDPEQLMQRFEDYCDLCERHDSKILVSGMCQSFGMTRNDVMDWAKGKRTRLDKMLSTESAAVLKNILQSLEVSWESAMQNNGYRNPVTGIFLGKNNFGYRDESQTVIKHEDAAQGPTKAELEAKYMASLPAEDVTIEKVEELPPSD